MRTIEDQWREGLLTDQEALRLLAGDLAEIDEIAERAEEAKKARRAVISEIVTHAGTNMKAAGLEFSMTAPSSSVSYDSKAITALIRDLHREFPGDKDIANICDRLANCGKPSFRAGGLRVTRTK